MHSANMVASIRPTVYRLPSHALFSEWNGSDNSINAAEVTGAKMDSRTQDLSRIRQPEIRRPSNPRPVWIWSLGHLCLPSSKPGTSRGAAYYFDLSYFRSIGEEVGRADHSYFLVRLSGLSDLLHFNFVRFPSETAAWRRPKILQVHQTYVHASRKLGLEPRDSLGTVSLYDLKP
jgi:hypothetical protein